MRLPLLEPKPASSFSKQKVALLSLIAILIVGVFHNHANSAPMESAVGLPKTTVGNSIVKDYTDSKTKYSVGKKVKGVRVGSALNEVVDACEIIQVDPAERKIFLQPPGQILMLKAGDKIKARKSTLSTPYEVCEIVDWDAAKGMKVKTVKDAEFHVAKESEIMMPRPSKASEEITAIVKDYKDPDFIVHWKNEALIISVDNEAFQKANGERYDAIEEAGEWKTEAPKAKSGKASVYLAELNGGDDRGIWVEVRAAKDDTIANLHADWLKSPVTYSCALSKVPWKGKGHDDRKRKAGDLLSDAKQELDFTKAPPAKIDLYWEANQKGTKATMTKDATLPTTRATGADASSKFPTK